MCKRDHWLTFNFLNFELLLNFFSILLEGLNERNLLNRIEWLARLISLPVEMPRQVILQNFILDDFLNFQRAWAMMLNHTRGHSLRQHQIISRIPLRWNTLRVKPLMFVIIWLVLLNITIQAEWRRNQILVQAWGLGKLRRRLLIKKCRLGRCIFHLIKYY